MKNQCLCLYLIWWAASFCAISLRTEAQFPLARFHSLLLQMNHQGGTHQAVMGRREEDGSLRVVTQHRGMETDEEASGPNIIMLGARQNGVLWSPANHSCSSLMVEEAHSMRFYFTNTDSEMVRGTHHITHGGCAPLMMWRCDGTANATHGGTLVRAEIHPLGPQAAVELPISPSLAMPSNRTSSRGSQPISLHMMQRVDGARPN